MSKEKIKPQDNISNMHNGNKGTNGVNKQFAQVHGNRGKQMSPTPNNANQGGKK